METDPNTSLNSLRQVQQQLQENPVRFSHLWIPFLDTFLDVERVRYLAPDDLLAIEEMANVLTNPATTPLHPEDIWWRIVKSYDTRKEERQSRIFLARTYWHPSASGEWKEWCISDLVRRGAQGDDYLTIYIHYLQNQIHLAHERQVLNLLMSICHVDFASDNVQLKRAKEVAERLLANRIQIAGIQNAQGMYALLLQHNFNEATEYFLAVLKVSNTNVIALYGLLTAYLLSNAYQKIAELQNWIKTLNHSQDPIITGLITLSSTLQWLDHPDDDGSNTIDAHTIQLLEALNLQRFVGDIVNVAIGRLYLLIGEARRAAEYLNHAIANHPEKVQWRYYGAWANMLVGNKETLRNYYLSSTEWSSKWTIACLLLDQVLSETEKLQIYTYLEETAKTTTFASVITARIALARATHPPTMNWKAGTGSLEESLEALRTAIGTAFYTGNNEQVKHLITQPHFQRLPLADQLLWKGLQALLAGQFIQGRNLLERAAINYKYQRAAFVLATHLLEHKLLNEAKRFLSMITDEQNDPKLSLLRAYINEQEGEIDNAIAQYTQLGVSGKPGAYYALGNLYLSEAEKQRKSEHFADAQIHYKQAMHFFNRALDMGKESVPIDCKALALCTWFIASPDTYIDIWSEVQQLPASHRQWWLVWNAFLARLWYGSHSDIVSLYKHISPILKYAEQMKYATLLVITQKIAQVCTQAKDNEEVETFVKILDGIVQWSDQQSIKRLYQIGIAGATRTYYQYVPSQKRHQVLEDITHRMQADQANGYLALLLASIHLESHNQAAAVAALKAGFPTNHLVDRISSSIVQLLAGEIPLAQELSLVSENTTPELTLSSNLLKAIGAFITNDPSQGSEYLLATLNKNAAQTQTIVHLGRVLPFLWLYVSKRKENSSELVSLLRMLSENSHEVTLLVTMARCVTAMGEIEEAFQLWQRVMASELDDESLLLQEFAEFLYYRAIKMYLSGNTLKAIHYLHDASGYELGIDKEEDFENKAYLLELQVATERLLQNRFPQIYSNSLSIHSGHYHFLESIIEQHSRIKSMLMEKQTDNIKKEWPAVIQTHKSDIRFFHALAVLHWESAFAGLKQQKQSEEHWVASTALWILLLCTEKFWHYFARNHIPNEHVVHQSFDAFEQEVLLHEAVSNIFSIHSIQAQQEFTAGHYEIARIHLRCLDICRSGNEKMVSILNGYGLTFSFSIEQGKHTWITQQAHKLLEE